MSFLFKPIHTQLHTGNEPRKLLIEPIMCLGIEPDGWHALGIYQIYDENSGTIGRMIFEGKAWQFEGQLLSEIEQEEVAFLIRFYNDAAA